MSTKIIQLMTQIAGDLESCMQPLKDKNISFFSFTRVFNDGTRIDINNRPDMASEFYFGQDKLFSNYTPETNPRQIGTNMMYLNHLQNNNTVRFLKDQCKIDHMCVLLEKKNNYVDVYNYGTHPDLQKTYENYLDNLGLLKSFPYLVKEKLQHRIKHFEQTPIKLDFNEKQIQTNKGPTDQLGIQQYYIDRNGVYLTKRQMEFCYWLTHGKSPSEIATLMNISIGTCRRHMEAIKKALDVDHMYQLLYKLNQLALF